MDEVSCQIFPQCYSENARCIFWGEGKFGAKFSLCWTQRIPRGYFLSEGMKFLCQIFPLLCSVNAKRVFPEGRDEISVPNFFPLVCSAEYLKVLSSGIHTDIGDICA